MHIEDDGKSTPLPEQQYAEHLQQQRKEMAVANSAVQVRNAIVCAKDGFDDFDVRLGKAPTVRTEEQCRQEADEVCIELDESVMDMLAVGKSYLSRARDLAAMENRISVLLGQVVMLNPSCPDEHRPTAFTNALKATKLFKKAHNRILSMLDEQQALFLQRQQSKYSLSAKEVMQALKLYREVKQKAKTEKKAKKEEVKKE